MAVTYFGDGAVNIGSVLETMNLAAAWKLPLCFFIENNLYAVSTTVEEATAEPRLSARGLGFNIPSWKVDGMDPLAVYLAMQQALAHMRAGNGPTVIEADVYRFFHQNGPFPGSAFGYRSKEEEQSWRARGSAGTPGPRNEKARPVIDDAGLADLRETIKLAMAQAAAELLEADPAGKPGKRRIRPPVVAFAGLSRCRDSWAGPQRTGHRPGPVNWRPYRGGLQQRKFIDAIADVMNRRMETDDSIVVMGEDVTPSQGRYQRRHARPERAFSAAHSRYPDQRERLLRAGWRHGAGRTFQTGGGVHVSRLHVGRRPTRCSTRSARRGTCSGGQSDVPLVLRTKIAMGTGYGSQHSMDPAGIYVTNPGWRIVAAVHAVRLHRPDEHRVGLQGPGTGDRARRPVQPQRRSAGGRLGLSDSIRDRRPVRREGRDLTILTYLSMVGHSLEAVEADRHRCRSH
ncbi:MAG: thiamine pyrophosphate-dependent enzyme [Pseudomonas veronii]|nr:thiamine pyrophosphate-dependent enzyme [Pseudomonas veronii]